MFVIRKRAKIKEEEYCYWVPERNKEHISNNRFLRQELFVPNSKLILFRKKKFQKVFIKNIKSKKKKKKKKKIKKKKKKFSQEKLIEKHSSNYFKKLQQNFFFWKIAKLFEIFGKKK